MTRTIIKVPVEFLALNEEKVPLFLPIVCNFLKANSKTVGIFRVSGNKVKVMKLNEMLAQHVPIFPQDTAVADAASFLKLWLSTLPVPLIEPEVFNKYYISHNIGSIYSVVDHLPESKRKSLALIFSVLNKVLEDSSQNHMNMKNLSTCFVTALTQSNKKLKKSFPFQFFFDNLKAIMNEDQTDFVTPLTAAKNQEISVNIRSRPELSPKGRNRDSLSFIKTRNNHVPKHKRGAESLKVVSKYHK